MIPFVFLRPGDWRLHIFRVAALIICTQHAQYIWTLNMFFGVILWLLHLYCCCTFNACGTCAMNSFFYSPLLADNRLLVVIFCKCPIRPLLHYVLEIAGLCVKCFNCEMDKIMFILNAVIFLLNTLKDTASLWYFSWLIEMSCTVCA